MTNLPPQNLTMHAGQYNLTEDEMHVVGYCTCGWHTAMIEISDEPTTMAERSQAIAAAAGTASEAMIHHLGGYPCHSCGGLGELPTKKWEPDKMCPTCLGSKTEWPNKPEPPSRYGSRRR